MGLQEDRGIEATLRLQKGQQALTLEQEAEARRFAEERIRAQLDTAPVDEEQAEAFLWEAYAAAGLPPPRHIHWLDGPLELIAALGRDDELVSVDDTFTERVPHCVWDDLLGETGEIGRLRTDIIESIDCRVRNVERSVEKRHRAEFGHYYWNAETLAAKVWRVVTAPALERIKYTVGEALARAVSISFTHPNTDRPWKIDRIWARYESDHETYRWLSLCAYEGGHISPILSISIPITNRTRRMRWRSSRGSSGVSGWAGRWRWSSASPLSSRAMRLAILTGQGVRRSDMPMGGDSGRGMVSTGPPGSWSVRRKN